MQPNVISEVLDAVARIFMMRRTAAREFCEWAIRHPKEATLYLVGRRGFLVHPARLLEHTRKPRIRERFFRQKRIHRLRSLATLCDTVIVALQDLTPLNGIRDG